MVAGVHTEVVETTLADSAEELKIEAKAESEPAEIRTELAEKPIVEAAAETTTSPAEDTKLEVSEAKTEPVEEPNVEAPEAETEAAEHRTLETEETVREPAQEVKALPTDETKVESAQDSSAEEAKVEPVEETRVESTDVTPAEPIQNDQPEPLEEAKFDAEDSKAEPDDETRAEPAEEPEAKPAQGPDPVEEVKVEPVEDAKPSFAEEVKSETPGAGLSATIDEVPAESQREPILEVSEEQATEQKQDEPKDQEVAQAASSTPAQEQKPINKADATPAAELKARESPAEGDESKDTVQPTSGEQKTAERATGEEHPALLDTPGGSGMGQEVSECISQPTDTDLDLRRPDTHDTLDDTSMATATVMDNDTPGLDTTAGDGEDKGTDNTADSEAGIDGNAQSQETSEHHEVDAKVVTETPVTKIIVPEGSAQQIQPSDVQTHAEDESAIPAESEPVEDATPVPEPTKPPHEPVPAETSQAAEESRAVQESPSVVEPAVVEVQAASVEGSHTVDEPPVPEPAQADGDKHEVSVVVDEPAGAHEPAEAGAPAETEMPAKADESVIAEEPAVVEPPNVEQPVATEGPIDNQATVDPQEPTDIAEAAEAEEAVRTELSQAQMQPKTDEIVNAEPVSVEETAAAEQPSADIGAPTPTAIATEGDGQTEPTMEPVPASEQTAEEETVRASKEPSLTETKRAPDTPSEEYVLVEPTPVSKDAEVAERTLVEEAVVVEQTAASAADVKLEAEADTQHSTESHPEAGAESGLTESATHAVESDIGSKTVEDSIVGRAVQETASDYDPRDTSLSVNTATTYPLPTETTLTLPTETSLSLPDEAKEAPVGEQDRSIADDLHAKDIAVGAGVAGAVGVATALVTRNVAANAESGAPAVVERLEDSVAKPSAPDASDATFAEIPGERAIPEERSSKPVLAEEAKPVSVESSQVVVDNAVPLSESFHVVDKDAPAQEEAAEGDDKKKASSKDGEESVARSAVAVAGSEGRITDDGFLVAQRPTNQETGTEPAQEGVTLDCRVPTPGVVLPDLDDPVAKQLGRMRSLRRQRRNTIKQAEEMVAAAVVIYATAEALSPQGSPTRPSPGTDVFGPSGVQHDVKGKGKDIETPVVPLGHPSTLSEAEQERGRARSRDVGTPDPVADLSVDSRNRAREGTRADGVRVSHSSRRHSHHRSHRDSRDGSKEGSRRSHRSRSDSHTSARSRGDDNPPRTPTIHDSGFSEHASSPHSRRHRTPEEQAAHERRKEERRRAREVDRTRESSPGSPAKADRERDRSAPRERLERSSEYRQHLHSSRRLSQSRTSIDPKTETSTPTASKRFFDMKNGQSVLEVNFGSRDSVPPSASVRTTHTELKRSSTSRSTKMRRSEDRMAHGATDDETGPKVDKERREHQAKDLVTSVGEGMAAGPSSAGGGDADTQTHRARRQEKRERERERGAQKEKGGLRAAIKRFFTG